VARQTLFWFAAPGGTARLGAERMPVFIWEWAPGEMFYGFPDQGDGVKVAIHHQGETTTGDTVRRSVDPAEADRLRTLLAVRAPDLLGPVRDSAVCLYTNAPDDDFILDRHPEHARVVIASPCSGHGFKFAPVIGEILADLVEDRPVRFDLAPFRIDRAALRGAASI
jgi:sarcosine oxidase